MAMVKRIDSGRAILIERDRNHHKLKIEDTIIFEDIIIFSWKRYFAKKAKDTKMMMMKTPI